MKKKIEVEIEVCDVCGTEEGVWETCGVCQKAMCGTCVEEHALEYSTMYNMNIVCICNECEEKAKTETNPLYVLLQKLVEKQTAYKNWIEAFNAEVIELENEIAKMTGKEEKDFELL